jgi:hypothetical protein
MELIHAPSVPIFVKNPKVMEIFAIAFHQTTKPVIASPANITNFHAPNPL